MSDFILSDGTGNGFSTGVNKDKQLLVVAKSESVQEWISKNKGQAYQVRGQANLVNGTVIPLHIKNNSSTRRLIVTYIRHQVIGATGGTEFPNVSNYFRIGTNTSYDTGGTAVIPFNVHIGRKEQAEVTAYGNNPTLTGTVTETGDRWYTKANGDMSSYNKEGSLIIHPSEELELAYVGDHTGGIIETRLSFVMEEI